MSTQPAGGGNWKRIGSHTKDTSKMKAPTGPGAGEQSSTAIPHGHQGGHLPEGQQAKGGKQPPMGRFTRFLKYKGDAYCHTHEGLYMLMPEAEPSIGYKLQQITGNTKPITDGGEEITEDSAIHVIFRNLGSKSESGK